MLPGRMRGRVGLSFVCRAIFAILVTCLCARSLPAAVDYLKLKQNLVRLEYGEAFSITGKAADIRLPSPKEPAVQRPITEFMKLSGVELKYQISGLPPVSKTGVVQPDGAFSAPVDRLPENAQVTFTFVFNGELTPAFVSQQLQELLTAQAFQDSVRSFFDAARGGVSDVARLKLREFATELAGIIRKQLPADVKVDDTKSLADLLAEKMADEQIAAHFANLGVRRDNAIHELNRRKPELVSEKTSPSELRGAVEKQVDSLTAAKQEPPPSLTQFAETYDNLLKLFPQQVRVASSFTSTAENVGVKDFEKYAGVDIGTIYIPRVQELRAFFTVNIYLGAVEDTPAPPEPGATGGAKFWSGLRQRLSLSVGMSLRDISGRSQERSQLLSNNAFLGAAGFRLNKYFRITAGDAIMRDKATNKLVHAFCLGPSIDVSAIQNLRILFGKVK